MSLSLVSKSFIVSVFSLLVLSCAIHSPSPPTVEAALNLRKARLPNQKLESRVAHYLRAAELSVPLVHGAASESMIYNQAVAELAVLLRKSDQPAFWNNPFSVSADGLTYRLKFKPASDDGVWAPDYFTSLQLASDVNESEIKTVNTRSGFGGELVGIRKMEPRESFTMKSGINAAVTSVLNFSGNEATLSLEDPTKRSVIRIAGSPRPLAANFSAPNSAYPHINKRLVGFLEGLRPGWFMAESGVFCLQPYDPQRIPVIFVHGLISTPYIWFDPINQINQDPVLRSRYQPMVFAYPSGFPLAFVAMKFRDQLSEFQKTHPMPNGFILVGHSEGGLVTQMQTMTLTREDWKKAVGSKADKLFAKQQYLETIEKALLIKANPEVKRVIFISTPHRGSEMALDSIGKIASHLIRLPMTLINPFLSGIGQAASVMSGHPGQLPNSITSFSPGNPTLITMDTKKVVPPCHSIIGNRGLPGPLADSSDGVVPYWSSHLYYAKSEVIVPGPHSCYDFPEAIKEMKRILHLHLETIGGSARAPRL